jgi:hypothetical protein
MLFQLSIRSFNFIEIIFTALFVTTLSTDGINIILNVTRQKPNPASGI